MRAVSVAILVLALSGHAMAAEGTCKARATDKKLAGAALNQGDRAECRSSRKDGRCPPFTCL